MSDDPVEQALAELQDLVRCRCHPAYTGRGLRDPDCECDSAEAVTIVADHIEALTEQLDAALRYAEEAEACAEELKAKLAKAKGALHQIAGKKDYADDPWDIARAALADLTGAQKDGN